MSARDRLLLCLALATVLLPGAARADWVNDEAFLRKLKGHVKELKTSVAIFERHRRSLDMVEAGISSLQLGLADPEKKPRQIIEKLFSASFPKVALKLKQLPSKKHKGVKTWRWRLTMAGAPDRLLAAATGLQKLGMFIIPRTVEKTRLVRGTPWKLSLVGHHARLQEVPLKPLPKLKGSDAFATRTDPLGAQIKKLLKEAAKLRKRLAYIQQFEARINEIKRFLFHLRTLARLSRDPVPELSLAQRMELMRVQKVVHEGSRVTVSGRVHSPAFRKAARRWLEARSTPALRYRPGKLALRWGPVGKLPELPPPPKGAARGGPVCTLIAVQATAQMVAAAVGAEIASSPGAAHVPLTGKFKGRLNVGLEAAARALGLTIARHRHRAVLVVPAQRDQAVETLRQGLHHARKPMPRVAPTSSIGDLRLRMLVLAPGRNVAVLTDQAGKAHRVTRGVRLGRSGARVTAVGKKGITLLWVDGRTRDRLVIGMGRPRK